MPHTDLLARLEPVHQQSPVAWFTLLCTYYAARLGEVENRLVAAKVQPLRLPETPLRGLGADELRGCWARLRALLEQAVAFDRYALGLLSALDRTLEDLTPSVLDAEIAPGFDGGSYRVRRLVNPIAEHFAIPLPPQARQGTLAAYARRMVLVPVGQLGEFTIQCVRIREPVSKRLLAARDALSVAVWPFSGPIEYPAIDNYGRGSPEDFVVLKEPRNEAELVQQVEAAIVAASNEKTTILVFPELAFSPAMLGAARARLQAHGVGGFPILTVAGLCHAPLQASAHVHVNEAVVLGPDGVELHRHRKLRRFADAGLTSENIETGFILGVLETACGNFVTPICLDVFAPACKPVLLASHATVLLVPSLSAKTGPHEDAAREYAAKQLASTFVCNRTLAGFDARAASFYWRPGLGEPMRHDGTGSHLRFELASR